MRTVVTTGRGIRSLMILADRTVCDSGTAHGIGHFDGQWLIPNPLEGASPAVQSALGPANGVLNGWPPSAIPCSQTHTSITTRVSVLHCTSQPEHGLSLIPAQGLVAGA